jgi:Zn-dependent protease/predicted transcriptional regulator
MTDHALQLGRIRGIAVAVHWSWLIIFVLLTWSLATNFFPPSFPSWSPATYWLVGAVSALLLFVSVLVHELAHSFVAQSAGIPVRDITLFVFGGVSNIEQEPTSARTEFFVAVVGPATSLAIGAIAALLQGVAGGLPSELRGILYALAYYNVSLAIFNIIPGFPLDGGRVLRAVVWGVTGNLRRATRVATTVSHVFGYLFIFTGLFLSLTGAFISGIWLLFIGWFLNNGADMSMRQVELEASLGDARVRALMRPSPAVVPAEMSLLDVVDEYILGRNLRALPVVADGNRLVGLITLVEVRAVPREDWARTTVEQAMRPVDRLAVARPDEPLTHALPGLSQDGGELVPVVDGGRLVGVLTHADVIQYLHARQGTPSDAARQNVA